MRRLGLTLLVLSLTLIGGPARAEGTGPGGSLSPPSRGAIGFSPGAPLLSELAAKKSKRRASHIPSVARFLVPNPSRARALSFRSGLSPVTPCKGAAASLYPTWRAAGQALNIRWTLLAAITKVESGMGCNMGPSSAGAEGWTQFIPSTWDRWGTDADGDGTADPQNSVDAVFSSARYLRATGAPADYERAIFAYNHADWYVRLVLKTEREFAGLPAVDFPQVARLAERAQRLQRKLVLLNERVEYQEEESKRQRKLLRAARARLARAEKLLGVRERESLLAAGRVDELTVQYIQVTQGLSVGGERPMEGEDSLLRYIANASPSQALLVYGQARALLNQQAGVLTQLRRAAVRAQALQQQVADLVAIRGEAVSTRREAFTRRRVLLRGSRQDLRAARSKLGRYESTLSLYSSLTGGQSPEEGPFQGEGADQSLRGRFIWPISGQITGRFGEQRPGHLHQGIDIAAREGVPILASSNGRISRREGVGESGGYGNFLCVRHTESLESCYAHLSRFQPGSGRGESVRQREVIGYVGNTGHSFGAHLHFEIRIDGKGTDPLAYLPSQRARLDKG